LLSPATIIFDAITPPLIHFRSVSDAIIDA